jgi:dihydroorotate dehydrogenase (NAD+) catalytic subunit
MTNINTDIGKVKLKNPVLLASGTCGIAGREFESYFNLSDLGGIVTKSLSINPRTGNSTPRVVEIPNCGILNSIGLQNPGIDYFIKEELTYLKEKNATIILNVVGESMEDYLAVIDKIKDKKEITAIELNLSCPNVDGGLDFSQDPTKTSQLVSEVKKLTSIPVWAKLSPNVTDITLIAKACIDSGVEGLTLINTVIGLALDKKTLKPVLPRATGGYSGPAIKPIALRMVYQTHKKFPNTPIIGIGGIHTTQDAIEFLACGASAIQIGTASFKNPKTSIEIIDGLKKYMEENKIASVKEIVGQAHEQLAVK